MIPVLKIFVNYKQSGISNSFINTTMIEIEYEFRDSVHEMLLEGTSYDEPNESEIKEHCLHKGYESQNLEIWFDNLQKFWRFDANLVRIVL